MRTARKPSMADPSAFAVRGIMMVLVGLAALVLAFALVDTAYKGGEIRSTAPTLPR